MPHHVIEVLRRTSMSRPDQPAMRVKRRQGWESVTWSRYRQQVDLAARGLVALGVAPGDSLVIQGDNDPGWVMAHFAAIAARAVPAGIYTNCTADQCAYIARHCRATVAVVQTVRLLDRLLSIRSGLSDLRTIILLQGPAEGDGVINWQTLLELGRGIPESSLEERLAAIRSEDLCQLVYTSGTTERPKGVMLSHANILWMADRLTRLYDIGPEDDLISYLPLSHIAEQIVTIYGPVFTGACVWFAESLERLAENLLEVRPHMFLAVPRVWEKIQARIEAVGAARPLWQRRLSAWARKQGLAGGYAEQGGQPKPWSWTVVNWLIFSRLRQRLGLDRARGCYTAAAPIPLQTLEFFLSLGLPVLEIYGLSESTGPATVSTPGCYRTGRAGRALEGSEVKIETDGEICLRGPHISPGYYRDPAATGEAIDAEGWLHTGDIGEIDGEGFLRITDRKKELIITSGGKNVAPQPIENALRGIDLVSQAVVVGDRRRFLAALLTLDRDRLDEVGCRLGSAANSLATAASCPRIRAYLEAEIGRVNRSLARHETIKRFSILAGELSVDGGELTPTLKLKRRIIEQAYAAEIESLYR